LSPAATSIALLKFYAEDIHITEKELSEIDKNIKHKKTETIYRQTYHSRFVTFIKNLDMQLQFYTPHNDKLKEYIEGYYFMCERQSGLTETYLTFPNNYCIVTINLNSSVKLSKNRISISPSPVKNIYASFVFCYVNPIRVEYKTPIQEITIYFKPLGINHFVNNLDTMFSQKKMTEFIPQFPDFKSEMKKIFRIKDRALQIDALEAYWLSKLTIKNLTLVKTIVSDIESNRKIEDIARKHNMSRKHLNYIVQKNLGKSAIEYRKIHRFRNAISNKKKLKNLTELSYENLFFDQSHLIKDFKSLTKINPAASLKA
jgi:AraC-like DNA-binding protein